ncbi:MAG TPA: cell division protein ZapA [Vicinamibacteria bacterium]
MNEGEESTLIPVDIFGETYNIRADEDREYVKDLARYVDAKMKSITSTGGGGNSLKIAILAALNIADEFFRLQREHDGLRARFAAHADELTEVLDDVLSEG